MKRFFFSLIALAAAAASCTQSAVLDSPDLQGTEISFSPYTGRTPLTKAQSIEDPTGLAEDGGFNVYAFLNKTAEDGSIASTSTTPYMKDVNVYLPENADPETGWTYDDIVYWPDEESPSSLSFAAYSANAADYISWVEEGKEFIYNVPAKVGSQVDLLATDFQSNLKSTAQGGTVKLDFKHLLSRVGFKLVSTTDDGNVDVVIKSIKLVGDFPESGTVDLESAAEIVPIEGTEQVSYELMDFDDDIAEDGSFIIKNTTEPTEIYATHVIPEEVRKGTTYTELDSDVIEQNKSSRHMMIVPHKVNDDTKNRKDRILVTYQITDAIQRTAEVPLPSYFEFVASRAYEFYLTVSTKSISFTVEDYDWNDNTEIDKPVTPAESALKIVSATENIVNGKADGTANITAQIKNAEFKTLSLEYFSPEEGVWEPEGTELPYVAGQTDYVFEQVDVIPNQAYTFRVAAITKDDEEVWSSAFTLYTFPAVETRSASSVTGTTAVLNGLFPSSNGTLDLRRLGFIYSIDPEMAASPTTIDLDDLLSDRAENQNHPFAANVEKLNPNVSYYFQAFAANIKGTVMGDILSFTTPIITPIVHTQDPSNISLTSVKLNGRLEGNGGDTETIVGFVFSNKSDLSSPIEVDDISAKYFNTLPPFNFELELKNLQKNTQYYFQAYAQNGATDPYSSLNEGDIIAFTTKPEAVTKIITYGDDEVVLQAPDSNEGDAEEVMGFYMSSTLEKDTNGKLSGTYYSVMLKDKHNNVNINEDSTITISGLAPGTHYIQAYVKNISAETLGKILSFTTTTNGDKPIPDWGDGNGGNGGNGEIID